MPFAAPLKTDRSNTATGRALMHTLSPRRARTSCSAARLAVLAAVSLGACSSPFEVFAGRYALFSIDDETLPYTMTESSTIRVDVTGGFIEAHDRAVFTQSLAFLVVENGMASVDTVVTYGFWSQTPDGLTLYDSDDNPYPAQVRESTLSYVYDNRVWLFRK